MGMPNYLKKQLVDLIVVFVHRLHHVLYAQQATKSHLMMAHATQVHQLDFITIQPIVTMKVYNLLAVSKLFCCGCCYCLAAAAVVVSVVIVVVVAKINSYN